MGIFWLLAVLFLVSSRVQSDPFSLSPAAAASASERIYFLKKCGGAGCPYTASWLVHLDLFRKLTWWLDVTKMEAASFNV